MGNAGFCDNIDKLIDLDNNVKSLEIHIAYTISWKDSEKLFERYPFEDEIRNLINYVKSRYTLDMLRDDRVVRAYRDFFWKLGIDPTKTRPASEALVRRALRDQFPCINPVVDAGNIASAYTMVPIGMYDLDRVSLPLTIKFSQGGEKFKPIGGGEEVLEKDIPILVDSKGTVMHIYPHRDSMETCVTENTTKIVTIAAGVPGVEREVVMRAASIVVELLQKIGWSSCNLIIYKD
ncbi:MAG: phenylalanine--tRNA ligase beta subunit-related protein [Ignisphaera sp.]|uniref:B3/B4 tRNA-binding domain-containing protein n=1 Tax=Ignisphaera aggregans TaxID=334771 RepID=A0A7J3MYT0_9CREN